MSDDLIKRSDAIKALRKLGHEVVVIDKVCSLGVAGEFIDAIRAIPSADRPQGEWIPCGERLPKENTEVLMSLEWGVDIGEYRNGEWHSEWINHYDDDNVLAWMPLPKPWKGADNE